MCGCEGSKKWLSQNNWVCIRNAGAADNVYLLFTSSQLCTPALSWEECLPGDGLWPVSVGGCMGGLLLAVGAALGSVWVLPLPIGNSDFTVPTVSHNRQASTAEHRRMEVFCRALRDKE